MSKEWNENSQEFPIAPKMQTNIKEHSPLPNDFDLSGNEFTKLPDEFTDENWQGLNRKSGKSKQTQNRRHKKLIRKMAYMVASAVAVVSISQTLTPDTSTVIEKPSQEKEDYEFDWPKVPGLDGTYGGTQSENEDNATLNSNVTENKNPIFETEGQLLYVDDYDSYGWGYGNVIPVKVGELWGLVDYAGNTITEPSYTGYWSAANEDGYAILNDENGYYIIGQDGAVYNYDMSVTDLRIGAENIVSYSYSEPYADYGLTNTIVFERLDGTEIYRIQNSVEYDLWDCYVPFNDGNAYVYQSVENGKTTLTQLNLDGTYNVLDSNDESYYVMAPYWGYSGGYFVGTYPGAGGGYHLYNVNTLEASGRMIAINTNLFPEVDWVAWYNETYQNSLFGGEVEASGFLDYYYQDISWKSYFSNGYYFAHYDTYGCLEVILPNGTKDVLFNYFDVEDEDLNIAIAIYDHILFDDFKYLAVQDGDVWKYIDYNGNIVSGEYIDATSFNDDGYAMVLEADKKAYVIDGDFNKIKMFEAVESVENSGELFSLECNFAEGMERKAGTYIYCHQ